ncbi:MAG: fibronectin type III domain-containing protein [Verrucomicrobia bacterium]|nr:fibronectin type III domain-containing protein [Verrucomicrobiota bacterium]
MTQQLRVLLGFTNAPDHQIEEIAGAVINGLTGNAAYPNPPVSMADLQDALTAFTTAIAAQAQGGPAATANKNNKRDALVALLRQLAGYVQENCNNNLAQLLSSGFEAVSTNRARAPLAVPAILSVDNGNTGQLLIKVRPSANAKCYEVRCAAIGAGGAPGPWQSGGLFTNSRSMPLNGLIPGTSYSVQVRAVGGSTGYSDWSDTVSHMSL